ncbi:histone H2A-Bbd type 1-like [Tenrec ecaudatus]|uniref:histone H2A-Bbd type 1-like n=1 Tax=Tenrec ecaudatus TaxID=94439 RepID=UPI003F5A8E4D
MTGRSNCPRFSRYKKRPSSRSARAELQFPVSLVDHLLRKRSHVRRLSVFTPIFLTGILEYLTYNLLELAGKEAEKEGDVEIIPEHVERAVDNNQLLSFLFLSDANATPQTRGEMPHTRHEC